MINLARLRPALKPARDFICSLIVFCWLFIALSPFDAGQSPIPVLSLLNGAALTATTMPVSALPAAGHLGVSGVENTLPPYATPLISTVLALLFAAMMTLNLGLMRYLRRVNASSRRKVWRDG